MLREMNEKATQKLKRKVHREPNTGKVLVIPDKNGPNTAARSPKANQYAKH